MLVAKPGLDGHSSGAEQIAVAARDSGMEVVYSGIRLTPEQIAASARDEDPDVIGLSILSGSHLALIPEVLTQLRLVGVNAPVIVGGIIPEQDRDQLRALGIAAVYTPKDFDIARIMRETQALEPSSNPEEVLDELRAEKAGVVLLVGHEPHLGALLGRLVSGSGGLEIPMKKAAVARLTWEGSGPATLRALLPARILALLAAGE